MENTNYAQALSARILALRKEKGLTQEALAGQLGVSFQAVSKWENEQSCPDIALLPLLADIFEVTLDSLFGIERSAPAPEEANEKQTARHEPEWGNEPVFSAVGDLPWPDDQMLRGVVYWGRKLLGHEKMPKKLFSFNVNKSEYTWLLRYSPLNVTAECGLQVEGDVQGNAAAGSHVKCADIGGNVAAGGHIECGSIGDSAAAGGNINCNDVSGSASAGGGISGNDIGGDAEARTYIECNSIAGKVKAKKIIIKKQG